MSSILEAATVRDTGILRPLSALVDFKPTEAKPMKFASYVERQHRLELRLAVEFWSSDDALEDNKQYAERSLLQMLHQDVLRHVSRMRMAILNEDRIAALQLCDAIVRDIGL